jgi:two-component system KDP operon response regulator KdpE
MSAESVSTAVSRLGAPVIVLADVSTADFVTTSLVAGAFDFLLMPFDPDELETCLRFAVGRQTPSSGPSGIVRVGDTRIDLGARSLSREGYLPLSYSEWRLLEALLAASGEPVLYSELLTRLWSRQFSSAVDLLRLVAERVRTKIPLQEFFDVGYALVPE